MLRPQSCSLALLVGSACGIPDPCPEIGCKNMVRVVYDRPVTGPYDLLVDASGESVHARCSDPNALESSENPLELYCDAAGFELSGGPLADQRPNFVRITIVDVDEEVSLVEDVEVSLSKQYELYPDGCVPMCSSGAGTLLLP